MMIVPCKAMKEVKRCDTHTHIADILLDKISHLCPPNVLRLFASQLPVRPSAFSRIAICFSYRKIPPQVIHRLSDSLSHSYCIWFIMIFSASHLAKVGQWSIFDHFFTDDCFILILTNWELIESSTCCMSSWIRPITMRYGLR